MAGEQMPPQPGAEAPAGGEDNDMIKLIGNVSDGIAMLTDVFGSMDPALGEELAGYADGIKGVIEKAMAGGSAAAPAGGVSSPEAAGAKAIPASPAGVPRG